MKRIKSILSFILVFFLTISFLPATGVYAKLFGSGGARDLPEMVVANPSAIGDTGLQDFYRVTAVPIDTSRDAVTPFLAYSNSSKKVKLRKQVPNYPAPEDWWYFTTEERSKRAKVLYQGSVRTSVQVHGTDDSDLKKFMKIIGVSSYTNDWAVWDKAIKSKDVEKTEVSKNSKATRLLSFLLKDDYDSNTQYYFVFERVKVFKEVSSSKTVYTLISRQDYRYNQDSRSHIYAMLGKLGSLSDSKKRLYDNLYGYDYTLNGQTINATTDGWLNQGNEAPFGVGFLTGGNGKYGYAVYAGTAGNPPSKSKTILNIVLEYTGEPNTNNAKMYAKSSFISADKERYGWQAGKFIDAKGDAEKLLRLDDKAHTQFDFTYPYTFFGSHLTQVSTNKDFTLQSILDGSQGVYASSAITWASDPVKGNVKAVGCKIQPKGFATFLSSLGSVFDPASKSKSKVARDTYYSRAAIMAATASIGINFSNFVGSDGVTSMMLSVNKAETNYTKRASEVLSDKLSAGEYKKNLISIMRDISRGAYSLSSDTVIDKGRKKVNSEQVLGVAVSYVVKAKRVHSNKATINIT